jgi:hypothetical protein
VPQIEVLVRYTGKEATDNDIQEKLDKNDVSNYKEDHPDDSRWYKLAKEAMTYSVPREIIKKLKRKYHRGRIVPFHLSRSTR